MQRNIRKEKKEKSQKPKDKREKRKTKAKKRKAKKSQIEHIRRLERSGKITSSMLRGFPVHKYIMFLLSRYVVIYCSVQHSLEIY